MASYKMVSTLLFFFSFLLFFTPFSAFGPGQGCYIKTIYSLGDSIADTGNLLREGADGAFAAIAQLPYGETTFKRPTGRCSNGLLMIDYLALALDLPLLNPYLEKEGNFDHGANFAVAGATALDSSFFAKRGIVLPYTNSSLNVQLEWFKTHLRSICFSQQDCAKKLQHALIMVGEIGGNDYNYAFFAGRPLEEVVSYVPHVVETITNATKELIELGAVQLVVPGNFPIGCMPSYLTALHTQDITQYDRSSCLKGLNEFVMFHNSMLQEALQGLRQAYPHARIMYADYYHAFMQLLKNASFLGFDEWSVLKACCGSGGEYNFDAAKMCGAPGVFACENPEKRISWDGIHLTQEAYRIMARSLIAGGYAYPEYAVQKSWRSCP